MCSSDLVEECDELILWFGEGKYVIKAMELKMLHQPLTPNQQEKYNKRFQKEETAVLPGEEQQVDENGLPIEIKAVEASQGPTSKIPSKKINQKLDDSEDSNAVTSEEIPAQEDEETEVPEEIEIKVKTIDVDNEYNTINLQEELAKNLALLMGEEDMEAIDATMAMPFATLSQAAQSDTIMNAIVDDSIKNAIMAPLLQDTAELTPITEQDLLDSMEEHRQEEEALLQSEETIEEKLEVKIEEEIEVNNIPEHEDNIEETDAVKEPEDEFVDLEEQIYAALEEDLESEASNDKTKELKVIGQQTEEEISVPNDVSKAIIAVMEQMEAKQAEALSAIKAAAEEAVAEAAKTVAANKVNMAEGLSTEASDASPEVEKESNIEPEADQEEEEKEEKPQEEVSLTEPDADLEEKVNEQITGQLSLTDIMAEWEQTKKANEQKHIEEMRARVKQQTGPLFSDFDAMARASVAADLDLISPAEDVFAVVEPIEEETEEVVNIDLIAAEADDNEQEEIFVEEQIFEQEPISEQEPITEQEPVVEQEPVSEQELIFEPEEPVIPTKLLDTAEILGLEEKLVDALIVPESIEESPQVSIAEPVKLKDTDYIKALEPEQPEPISIEEEPVDEYAGLTPGEIAVIKLKNREARQQMESVVINPVISPQPELELSAADDIRLSGSRGLTKSEKEFFASFAPTKESQSKIADALDKMSLQADSGNMIISGEHGTGIETIAQNVLIELKTKYPHFSGKAAKISGELLSEKDIGATLDSLLNSALIIERAGNLTTDALGNLLYHLDRLKGQPLFIIIEDTEAEVERLKLTYPNLVIIFNAGIRIEALDNDGLINYAKEYAKENEYSIDEMGVLALYTKISDMQAVDHAVTVEEVREMVDYAISNAERKNVSHFMDIILAKRYDGEDMVVLREKDFMN